MLVVVLSALVLALVAVWLIRQHRVIGLREEIRTLQRETSARLDHLEKDIEQVKADVEELRPDHFTDPPKSTAEPWRRPFNLTARSNSFN